MIEPRPGVFVGNLSGMVRDRLWEDVCKKAKDGGAMLTYTTDNEQGFALRMWGSPNRVVRDFEGLALITVPR